MAKFSEAIISIKPKFARAILSGEKSIELRRRIPPIEAGSRLWIYETRPTAAVVGSALVKCVVRGSLDEIWARASGRAHLDRGAYDNYFEGVNEAIGIVLADVRRGRSVSIEQLRGIRDGFHPPQVILRISDSEATALSQALGFE